MEWGWVILTPFLVLGWAVFCAIIINFVANATKGRDTDGPYPPRS
jgi:hypothetical protein